ncbi:MAG: lmo0937 family membrane protein [Parcubacteria group bacterium]
MLTTIAVLLLILWILGVIGTYTIGWFVHLLLVMAIILFLIRIIQGKNPVK